MRSLTNGPLAWNLQMRARGFGNAYITAQGKAMLRDFIREPDLDWLRKAL